MTAGARGIALGMLILSALAGCVSAPAGPRAVVMPTPGKPIEVFSVEDSACRAYAARGTGADPNAAGAQNLVASAAIGTALGAVTGAALGGHEAAAPGAGMGLMAGTLFGTGLAGEAQLDAQRRYDIAYEQCMYAKGNQLPQAYGYRQAGTVVVTDGAADYPPADYPPPPPLR